MLKYIVTIEAVETSVDTRRSWKKVRDEPDEKGETYAYVDPDGSMLTSKSEVYKQILQNLDLNAVAVFLNSQPKSGD